MIRHSRLPNGQIRQNPQTRQQASDLRNILERPEGRRLLQRLIRVSGVLRQSYAGHDTTGTAFNEGCRSMGIYLLNQVSAYAPESFLTILEPEQGEQHEFDGHGNDELFNG